MMVKLQDIVDAMEMADQESDNYLDLENGEIVWISEMAMSLKEQQELSDRLDEHGCVQLPSSYDIRDYDILTDFIETLPEDAQDKLRPQVQGRGAFSRFKNAIIQLEIDQDWYAFKEEMYRKKAIEWCEENEIEYV